jgi:ABC-2 type transport system permease protein
VVRILIGMKAAALKNMHRTRVGTASIVIAVVLGILTSGATLLLGMTAPTSGGADEIALILLAWAAGRVGFSAFAGADSSLPLDLLRTLPLPAARLARALLVIAFADPALAFLAIASGSVIAFGFRQGIVAGVIGTVGALLFIVSTSLLSTVVSTLVPTGSRRRRDSGTLLAALLISAVFVTGTAAPAVLAALATGELPVLSAVVRLLPTGWAPTATALAAQGALGASLGMLALLLLLSAALFTAWPAVLRKRMESAGGAPRRRAHARPRRMLSNGPVTAVAARELRLWIRDPIRAGFLVIAFVVGLGACAVPLFARGSEVMLPFVGPGTALIAAAMAGNTYGFDGPVLGLTLTAPGSESAEVRGRQLAWLLLAGPYAVLLGVAGLLIAGSGNEWAWILALTAAVLGGGAGAAALISTVAPQPLDEGGGPTPAWTLKIYATLILTALLTAPALVLLIAGTVTGSVWLDWAAIAVAVIVGVGAAALLGSAAGRRLVRYGPEMLVALSGSTGRG